LLLAFTLIGDDQKRAQVQIRFIVMSARFLQMDLAREGQMLLKRIVIASGLASMAFGVWAFTRVYSEVGTCSSNTGAAARSGLNSSCVQTVMSYSMGFVFVASGLIIIAIAFTMIGKQERIDLRTDLRAVPRKWAKPEYVTGTSEVSRIGAAPRKLQSVRTG